jgi:hypothetical protein
VRQANAIDFWRGFALVTIFINHIPGFFFASFTHGNVSFSDSAELFVFLAGWSLRYVVGRDERRIPTSTLVFRLSSRAFTIYAAQILITSIAVAMLAATAMLLEIPLILEWHNAAAVFQDPVPAHIGLVLLTYQLGYFDILPLYVVVMLMAPGIGLIDRYAPNWLLPISFAIYCVTLAVPIAIPSWPVEGQWFFNPLAWQFIFVLGFVLSRDGGIGNIVRQNIMTTRIIGIVIVVVGLYVFFYLWPDPTRMPQPRLFFINEKTYETPVRVIQFLGLVAAFSGVFPFIRMVAPPLVSALSMLGRNSLEVFCVSSVLSLGGAIMRFIYRGDILIDIIVLFVGIVVLVMTAWLAEWRDRAQSRTAVRSPAPSSAPSS